MDSEPKSLFDLLFVIWLIGFTICAFGFALVGLASGRSKDGKEKEDTDGY